MSFPSTATPVRLPRWPFLMLLIVAAAGLWALASRQPAPWPDAATPWFEQVRALAPGSWAIDAANARIAVAPDLPIGSALVLLALMACVLATLLAIEVPATLALAVALGLGATRSLWSTVTPGRDALGVVVVTIVVLGVTRSYRSGRATAAATLAGVALAPAAAWVVAPGVASLTGTRRGRWLAAVAVVVLSTCVQILLLRHAWSSIACLPPGEWTGAWLDVLRPGRSADASSSFALRQALAVLTGDVHLFGILVATLGLFRASGSLHRLRAASLVALGAGIVAVAAGLLSPSLAVALFLPWWAAWFGRGLAMLIGDASGHARPLATCLGIIVALVTPVLRHATVAPSPWVASTPSVARAVSDHWRDGSVVSEDHGVTRRLRLVGASTVPADAHTLALCVAAGRPVYALGSAIQRVEYLGHAIAERPLRAPLAAILHDVRPDQLVALALSPTAVPWTGSAGLALLPRLSLARETLVGSPAVGVVARTDRTGEVRAGRGGIDLALRTGDIIGGRQLLAPISVSAHEADAAVDSASDRLVHSRQAALAVFDRSQDVPLRAVGESAPGLPMPLMRHADWRQVGVSGAAACLPASTTWTRLPTDARRLSVPTGAARRRRPVLLYLGSATRPAIGVTGLPVHPLWPAWAADAFDTRVPTEIDRLRSVEAIDAVPAALRLRATWVTRVAIEPRDLWDAHRVAVSAGVTAAAWIVRLASDGFRAETTAVCPMASTGDRLLQGQYGALDDESAREIAVRAADGWHPAERLHRDVFQWTARPVATASFQVDGPKPLTLAIDATGAASAEGPQPVLVRLNDRVLRTDWRGAGRIDIAADVVHAGENTLSFEVGRVVQPARDTRAFGVLVRQLRVIEPPRP